MRLLISCAIILLLSGCDMNKISSFFSSQKKVYQSKSMTALLKNKEGGTAFVAKINLEDEKIKIRRVTNAPVANKSYELWAIQPNKKAPYSLGVLGSNTEVSASKLGKLEASWLENTTLAVSLEPSGGSPNGKVSGPVLFTGKLQVSGA